MPPRRLHNYSVRLADELGTPWRHAGASEEGYPVKGENNMLREANKEENGVTSTCQHDERECYKLKNATKGNEGTAAVANDDISASSETVEHGMQNVPGGDRSWANVKQSPISLDTMLQ